MTEIPIGQGMRLDESQTLAHAQLPPVAKKRAETLFGEIHADLVRLGVPDLAGFTQYMQDRSPDDPDIASILSRVDRYRNMLERGGVVDWMDLDIEKTVDFECPIVHWSGFLPTGKVAVDHVATSSEGLAFADPQTGALTVARPRAGGRIGNPIALPRKGRCF